MASAAKGLTLESPSLVAPISPFVIQTKCFSLLKRISCLLVLVHPDFTFLIFVHTNTNPFSVANLLLSSGIFPDNLKLGKVSLWTYFSKIFEKIVYSGLLLFFDKHSILASNQYGFRENGCTSHAILDILTSMQDNINAKLYRNSLIWFDQSFWHCLSWKISHKIGTFWR